MSINGVYDDYHKNAELRLEKWLRKSKYEEYIVPSDTILLPNIHKETLFQMVNSKKVPYTNLSCFYNDMECFRLITQYSKDNNIEYNIIMKFRPDIYFTNTDTWSNIHLDIDENTLYSCIPPCEIYIWGDRRAPRCISDAFAYGSKKVMAQYCNTYSFIIKKNNERNGNYRINYEPCATENFCNYALDLEKDNYQTILQMYRNAPYRVHYFSAHYEIDKTRRDRDNFKECGRGGLY